MMFKEQMWDFPSICSAVYAGNESLNVKRKERRTSSEGVISVSCRVDCTRQTRWSLLPVAQKKAMRNVEIVEVQHDQRDWVVPLESVGEPPGHGADHPAKGGYAPDPAEDAHVAVLVALVGLGVARGGPHQLDVEEAVLDGGQVGVGLDQHDVLDVHAVRGLGPHPEDHQAVEQRRHGEGEVVVLEPLRAEPEEEDARDGGDEDTERDG